MIVTTSMQLIFIFQTPGLILSILWYGNGFVDAVGRPDFFSQMVLVILSSFTINTNVRSCNLGEELECYYCSYDNNLTECTEEIQGEIVTCQMDSPEVGHYGNTCVVAHSGK